MNRRKLLVALPPLAALAACAMPEAVVAGEIVEVTATVETIDRQTREVLLSAPAGRLLTVVAGPAVRNLAEIGPGQRLRVHYAEALGVALARAPATGPDLAAAVAAARAAPDQLPGGVVGEVVRLRVRITGAEPLRGSVTFVGPRSIPRTLRVRDPELQAFVRGLRVGDEVDIAYLEALAVRMEPG